MPTWHITPVGQGVTHGGVPLYGHTDHQVDGAAEGDPDQESSDWDIDINQSICIYLYSG